MFFGGVCLWHWGHYRFVMWYSILEPERTDTISGLYLDVTLRALQESFGERLKRLQGLTDNNSPPRQSN